MKPLILDFAIERKGDRDVLYKYDYKESLNIIDVNGQKIPFVDSTNEQLNLLTGTKVFRESDDFDINHLEMSTKTEANRERDDAANLLLELLTKTFTARESDD